MAEHEAATLTPASVQAAADLCSPGDTVVMPAGDASTWSSIVYIPVGVNLKGQGVDSTIIRQPSTTNRFFYFNSASTTHGYTVEIQGFTCVGPSGVIDTPTWPTSTGTGFAIEVRNSTVLIHDVNLHNKNYGFVMRSCSGVIYDCAFRWMINNYSTATHGSGGYGVAVEPVSGTWPIEYPAFGSGDALFIEDCTFYGCKHAIASNGGKVYVARYNTISAGWYVHGCLDAHGKRGTTEGAISTEYYHNDVYLATQTAYSDSGTINYGVLHRGGQAVIWNNAFHSGAGTSSDAIVISPVDITDAGTYVFPDDYPIYWQPRNVWIWGNTYDGAAVDAYENSAWFEEDRSSTNSMGTYYDYVNSAKSGYVDYVYPHPLRPTAGGGTYKMMHGVKVKLV